jgi:hypothetical protein
MIFWRGQLIFWREQWRAEAFGQVRGWKYSVVEPFGEGRLVSGHESVRFG